jgi:hypothetical protein
MKCANPKCGHDEREHVDGCQACLHNPSGFVCMSFVPAPEEGTGESGPDAWLVEQLARDKIRWAGQHAATHASVAETAEMLVTRERLENAIGAVLPWSIPEEQRYEIMAKVAEKLMRDGIVAALDGHHGEPK